MDIGHLICFSLILGPKEFRPGVNADWENERTEVYWSNTPEERTPFDD